MKMKSPQKGSSRQTCRFVILLWTLFHSAATTSATIDATVRINRGTRGSSGVGVGRRRFFDAPKRNGGRWAAAGAAFVWRAPIDVAVIDGGGGSRSLPSSPSPPQSRSCPFNARTPRLHPGGGPSWRRFNAAKSTRSWRLCGSAIATTTTAMPSFPRSWGVGSSSLVKGYLYLSVASAVGMVFERLPFPGAGDWGIIVTMAAAATLSNVGAAPSSHPAYETCWTRVLPMSLALLLLSSSSSPTPSSQSSEATNKITADESLGTARSEDYVEGRGAGSSLDTIMAVSVPFAVGCAGSVLGCAASFLRLSSSSKPPRLLRGCAMDPSDAALAAGCLCSSYVGGTVNFFQTARILLDGGGAGGVGGGMGGLFGAMAGADLIVMAVYFAALAALRSSSTMWSWFPGRRSGVAATSSATECGDDLTSTADASGISKPAAAVDSGAGSPSMDQDRPQPGSIAGVGDSCGVPSLASAASRRLWTTETATSVALALALSWIIVDASNAIERRLLLSTGLPLHGVGCACIALFSTAASVLLGRGASRTEEGSRTSRVSRRADAVSPTLSSACFHLLFASMGFSANVAEAVVVRGPACLAFALFALAVHVAVAVGGTAVLSWVFRRFRSRPLGLGLGRVLPLGWDEVMVASNAAIGGPATAAAFAGTFFDNRRASTGGGGGVDDGDRTHTRDLVLAATVWGVFGYAVGTGVGVALTGVLTRFFVR